MPTLTEVVFVEPLAVKISTAADMLQVGTGTVYKLIRKGTLKTTRIPGCADQRVLISSIKQVIATKE
jgi:excisionase family DNA binding protein